MSNNFSSALGQLRGLKRRIDADSSLKQRYSDTIASDYKKGYVTILSSAELAETANQPVWYVPHHPVLNPHKPDKVRRVCNAASKFRGYSLNDVLLADPDLLASLMGILARFRENKYAMSADIEEMFLQVEVKPEDRKFLRFLWFDENYKVSLTSTIDTSLALNHPLHVLILLCRDVQPTMQTDQSEQVTLPVTISIWMICLFHLRAKMTLPE